MSMATGSVVRAGRQDSFGVRLVPLGLYLDHVAVPVGSSFPGLIELPGN
jgi:hypothetical protein